LPDEKIKNPSLAPPGPKTSFREKFRSFAGVAKDGLKLRCENVNLFLSEP
jgi:hypothetical protein